MKKLIVLILIMISVSFAQNEDKETTGGKLPSEQQMMHRVYEKTLELFRFKPIPVTITFTKDTLVYGDTTSIGYFANQYLLNGVTIRDTGLTTAAGLQDSVVFEELDSTNNVWIPVAVKNLQTGALITAGTVLVTSSGTITRYQFYKYYSGTVRVRRINSALGLMGASGKTPVQFWGHN